MRFGAGDANREALLRRLGIVPRPGDLVRRALDGAVERADASGPTKLAVLDAGCGHRSALTRYRSRIGRFVGVDLHAPESGALPYLDEFARVDVCVERDAFPPATFDIVLSSFTVEHFSDPVGAFANFARWLRPGGTLVLKTVNRRHPFVAAYLGIPSTLRRRLQPLVKASAADAHPLVGACNDPAAIRTALQRAGFEDVRIQTVGHLARAWGRHLPTFTLGLIGDVLTRDLPSRRSTLVVCARAPR
jgi:SAM-dependent methyltransferase